MGSRLAFANTGDDLEAGSTVEPMMPELRCSFTRKIYILAIQLLLNVVGAVVGTYHPIVTFLTTTTGGLACYIVIIITPFVMKLISEMSALTTIVIVSLGLFTLWASKRGYGFYFLGPFLFGAIMVLLIFVVIQIVFPQDGILVLLYGCLPATIFDLMERFGSHLTVELATDLIANSPLKSNNQFAMNCSMTNLGKPISEVRFIIKTDDKNIPPKPSQVLKGKEQNRKPKTSKAKGKGVAKIKEFDAKLVPNYKKKQVKDLDCFHCGEPGHLRRNCQSYLEDLNKGKAGQTSTQGVESKYIM